MGAGIAINSSVTSESKTGGESIQGWASSFRLGRCQWPKGTGDKIL